MIFKAENTYRSFPRSCVGMSPGTLRVPLLDGDAERHGMHSHAERGNDQTRCARKIEFTALELLRSPAGRCDVSLNPLAIKAGL